MKPGDKLLLSITGCIAAYKSCSLVSTLTQYGIEVQVVMSKAAQSLVGPLSFQALSGRKVITEGRSQKSDHGMDHIECARWGEIHLIAPCTANMLSKIANGLADDLISTTSLAFSGKQIIVPAMNPVMWSKASTQRNIEQLKEDGFFVIPPDSGMMACGDQGMGRFPEEQTLLKALDIKI